MIVHKLNQILWWTKVKRELQMLSNESLKADLKKRIKIMAPSLAVWRRYAFKGAFVNAFRGFIMV